MLCKKVKTNEDNKSSMNKSKNFGKKITVAKSINGKSTSLTKCYQVENLSCGLNYWGAGSMDEDFMF